MKYRILLLLSFLMMASAVWGQILLTDDFDYSGNLTSNGWTAHSNTTPPIDTTDGLSFTGYIGSGIGNAANIDNNGQDVNRTFTSQSSGTVYVSFLLQTGSSNSAGYFFHLGSPGGTNWTDFYPRLFVNATGTGIGISENSTAPPAGDMVSITAGTTYLVVIKRNIAANNKTDLFVFSSLPTSEPTTPDQTYNVSGAGKTISAIGLRQYNANQRQIVDGIRVAKSWEDIFASVEPNITLSNNDTQVTAGNVEQGTQNHILSTFKLDVTDAGAELNEAYFTTIGTYQAADVDGFKLWYSNTDNFTTANQLGSTFTSTSTGSGDLLEFNGLSQSINEDATGYFWVTADVSATATTGRAISLDAIAGADFEFASGNATGSASAGGTQTITVNTSPAIVIENIENTDFGSVCVGSTSATTGSFDFYGMNLTGNAIIGPLTGYTFSTDALTFYPNLTLLPDGGGDILEEIYIRFTPASTGSFNGNIPISGGDATPTSVAVTGTGITLPSITAQPADQSVTVGQTATFSVTATGATSYQWEENTGSGWDTIAGATSASYTTPNTTLGMDGYQYRVIVTNTCGDTTSSAAVLTVTEGPIAKTYTLVTDVSQLEAGKKYLIANSATAGNRQAMGLQNNNNRAQSAVTVVTGSPNTITTLPASTSSGTEPFEFTLGGSSGAWTFYDPLEGGYLYAASSSSNYLRTQTTNNANGQWTITITNPNNPEATIVANGTNTNKNLKYNSSASIFSAYSSGQGAIYLYKEGGVASTDTYFRSQANGNWTSSSTWESSEDGVDWAAATTYPGATAESVVILADHTVNLNSASVTVTNTQVYGTLEVTTTGSYSVSGEENAVELTIENGGTFLVSSPGGFSVPDGNAWGLVKTGGKLVAGPLMGINSGTAFANAYLGRATGLFYFGDAAVCEWANPSTTLGSSAPAPGNRNFFYPYEEGDMPIFRVTATPAYPFGAPAYDNIFHSIIEIIEPANFTLVNNGTKTFVGGVSGNGELIMANSFDTYDSCGPVIIGNSSIIPILDGTATIVTNSTNDRLKFPNGANVTVGSNFTIENTENTENVAFERQGNFDIHGTLDITNMRITNTAAGGIFVKNGGTLRTRHTGGLFGSGSAIVNDTNFTMETGSTIDYYADETQAISSGKEYYNLIFSGNGIKNPQNATNVNTNGSILITGNPTVDYSGHNLGYTSGNSTAFTMNGGKLIIGTGGTQPRPGGHYNITGGAIEFTGSSQTDIRVSPEYHDVIISGQNITPGGKVFTIKNVLSVTPTGEIKIPSTPDDETPYVVTAKKGVQVMEGGQLTFENNAILMQDADAVNSGNIVMQRFVEDLDNDIVNQMDYVYWSSPVSPQGLQSFSPGSQYVLRYNETDDYFYYVNFGTEPNFILGKGYAFSAEVDTEHPVSSTGYDETYSFTGTPHNGDIEFNDLRKNSDTSQGFNLVGNPYPSNIHADHLFNANSSIYATVLFWTNSVDYTPTQQGSNYNGNNYSIYNKTGGNPATNYGNAFEIPNGIIKTGQGFMVQKKETGTSSLVFNNDMRITTNGTFYQKSGQVDKDRFWLTMTTYQGVVNTTLIGYIPGATNDFEQDYDAELMGGADAVYTILGDKNLSIQGREYPFNTNEVIPLGVRFYQTGKFIIDIKDKEGIFDGSQRIYLKDKYLNKTHILSQSYYEFESHAGEYNDRFELFFRPSFSTSVVNPAWTIITQKQNDIFIYTSEDIIKDVEIVNLFGWPVYRQSNVNATELRIPSQSLGKQILVVKVKTESGKIETKKIINK